jgi:hypothetical protein
MLVTNLVLIISERKSPMVILAIVAILGVGGSTFVGELYIIPVNHLIGAGLATQEELHDKLGDWMSYNSIRFWLMTMMWLALMTYFVLRGRLLSVLAGQQQ